jgi:carbon monoxide dehydrogenase subunit G
VPETEYSTTVRLPVETIWDFVREMDNWAPFVTGYQSHRKENENDSRWVLKGDVGVLTRTLEFRVHVTEWAAPHRVAFELAGLNEPMRGSGEFRIERCAEGSAAAPVLATSQQRGPMHWLEALFRWVFRRLRGGVASEPGADPGPGEGGATLAFRLRLDPGGPMAPMLSAMMKPALRPAAEDLANRIVAHLEKRHGRA